MDYRILSDYVASFVRADNPAIEEIETNARERNIPIMQPESMAFVQQLIKWTEPKRILEIGTAVGYSSIKMALASNQTADILTIERDGKMVQEAMNNIEQNGLSGNIQVIHADARELQPEVVSHAPYDVIFIDAAKGQYQHFFEQYASLLAANGKIISDNVLFRGLVVNPESVENKRLRRIAEKVDRFNRWLAGQEAFETVFLTVGDGIAVSSRNRASV